MFLLLVVDTTARRLTLLRARLTHVVRGLISLSWRVSNQSMQTCTGGPSPLREVLTQTCHQSPPYYFGLLPAAIAASAALPAFVG